MQKNPLKAKYRGVWLHWFQEAMWFIASGHCLSVHSIDNYMVLGERCRVSADEAKVV